MRKILPLRKCVMMNWRHCGFGDDRVTLDMLSVQSKPDVRWEDKVEMAFWRGRDSRRERLDLIRMARRHPDLLNASRTNFFFFRYLEAELGPKQEHVSFFRFFDVRFFSISRGTRFFLFVFGRAAMMTSVVGFAVQVPGQHRRHGGGVPVPVPVGR